MRAIHASLQRSTRSVLLQQGRGPRLQRLQLQRHGAVGGLAPHGARLAHHDVGGRHYAWVSEEAEELIAKAYTRHRALADSGGSFPPSLGVEDLEKVGEPFHYEPKTGRDKIALGVTKVLEKFMEMFFREKYDHHAVTLETVAAVPGMVGAGFRHFRSLRRMQRDHGWIVPLLEESENERLHLLIWMQHCKPSAIERAFVVVAQVSYVTFYTFMYAVSPRTAHRAVGYLEEAAHRAYTDYLEAIDSGKIPNVPAGSIAKKYYRLPDDAMLRDVVLHVRADEAMHRDTNHHLANRYEEGAQDEQPVFMMDEVIDLQKQREAKAQASAADAATK